MALVPGFEYDIFISYVHDDNDPEIEGEDGWVDQFYKYLDTKLNKHNKEIKIWWDARNLDKSEKFDISIADALDKSAIMICLYSRRYAQSDYCIKELNHFYKKAKSEKTGLLVENHSRIIPLLLSNIHHNDWPDNLRGTSSFTFHDARDSQDYGDPLEIRTQGSFNDEMKILRSELVKIMEGFPKEHIAPDKSQKIEPSSDEDNPFVIYFGEVNDSLYDRRDGIIAELESNGFKIILGDSSSAEFEAHQQITKEAIDGAQLAVHLLGEYPGKKIKEAPNDKRYQQQQVEIGLESATPQLIWIHEEFKFSKIKNKVYLDFLKSLDDKSLIAKDYEYVIGNEGNLAKVILDHVERLEDEIFEEQVNEKANGSAPLKVLLDTHIDDFKNAFNLKKILNKYNIQLIFNPEDGDPQKNIKSLYNNIREANKFIFLYGNERNKDWVEIRVKNTLKKLMEYDRFTQDVFIYVAPPPKRSELIQSISISQSPLVKVINNSDKPTTDGELLVQFLNDLKLKSDEQANL